MRFKLFFQNGVSLLAHGIAFFLVKHKKTMARARHPSL